MRYRVGGTLRGRGAGEPSSLEHGYERFQPWSTLFKAHGPMHTTRIFASWLIESEGCLCAFVKHIQKLCCSAHWGWLSMKCGIYHLMPLCWLVFAATPSRPCIWALLILLFIQVHYILANQQIYSIYIYIYVRNSNWSKGWWGTLRSRHTAGRDSTNNWLGNIGYGFVRTGNLLAARVILLLIVIVARKARFILEQPVNSTLPNHPRFQQFLRIAKATWLQSVLFGYMTVKVEKL